MYIFIIAWLLSPLVLIPLFIKKSRKNAKLEKFIDDLYRNGRISSAEYISRKAEKNGSKAAAKKPDVPAAESENQKYLYDLPVYTSVKTNSDTVSKPENNTVNVVKRPAPAAAKPAAENAPPKKKRAAAMSVLMMIGIIFVILAGLVFSTAVWVNLGNAGRTCAIGIVSALFFGISVFAGKKLRLDRTSFAFYILGTFFSAITLITAGFFGLMGRYFSVGGNGSCLLYASALLMICLLSAKGRSIFDKPAAAYISAFAGAFSAVLILAQLSSDMGGFALLAAIFTTVTNIFAYALEIKLSDKWEKPLRTVAAALNIIALLGGISASFGNSPAFYAAAAILVLRSAGAAVMGFKGRRFYTSRLAAAASLGTGAFFALLLMWKLSGSAEVFALSAAIFAVLFAFGFFTFNIVIPKGWNYPIKITAFILNTVGILSSLYVLMRDFGEWHGVCFAIAGIYIFSSFAAGIMAVRGRRAYGEAPSAFASMFTGLAFSVMLVSELSASTAMTALCLTAMLLVLVNAVYTLPSKLPEGWKAAACISSALLGLISVISSLIALIGSFGNWDASCYTVSALYVVQSIVITAAAYRGHSEYSKRRWAVLSQLIGITFALTALAQPAESAAGYMLIFTVFAAGYLNFVHTFRLNRPEKWEAPLKIFSAILGISGVILTFCRMCGHSKWTYHFYASAGIYIAYSAAVTAMAFLKHGEYSKTHWAAISQLTGMILSLCVIYKLVYPPELFALLFAAFAALYSAGVYLAFVKMPEKWLRAANIIDIAFSAAAAVSAAIVTINAFGDWDIYCFLTALLYTAYTAARGIHNDNRLLKAAESVIVSLAAYNLYCVMERDDIIVPEFFLVCMLFALSLVHHYAKPLRTVFSDFYLTAVMTISAVACAAEYNIYICGILGFALLGAVMLIKSAENGSKIPTVFKALLPLPVTGMASAFVYYNISDSFGNIAAVDAALLAVIAAAVLLIRKRSDAAFFSFGLVSSVMVFLGTQSDNTVMLIILLGASVMLTALYRVSINNLPSLLTMAGAAAVTCRLSEITSRNTDINVSLLYAVIFAALSLAASRVLYSRKLLTRENERVSLDTCCAGMLLALPMVTSPNGKTAAFTVLTILAAFAANLARKEHKDDLNKAALTAGSVLLAIALIFRPFLIASDPLISGKITLGIICAFGYAFSKIWAKYPRLSENFSSAVYGVSFVCLIIDALSHQNLINTLIVLGVSAVILLYSFISKKKRWFAVSSVSLTGLTVYTFRDFFTMIDWWVYLLIVGLILIAVSSANEYFVRKGREFKEKAGRFFEDWKW